ncbi:MAG: aldehyde dehydrogenase (NADP(+)), partial [Pseudomonadota bacterium]
MSLEGKMLIGREAVSGSSQPITAVDPATGETLEPNYVGGTRAEVERACELAEAAYATYRETSL